MQKLELALVCFGNGKIVHLITSAIALGFALAYFTICRDNVTSDRSTSSVAVWRLWCLLIVMGRESVLVTVTTRINWLQLILQVLPFWLSCRLPQVNHVAQLSVPPGQPCVWQAVNRLQYDKSRAAGGGGGWVKRWTAWSPLSAEWMRTRVWALTTH